MNALVAVSALATHRLDLDAGTWATDPIAPPAPAGPGRPGRVAGAAYDGASLYMLDSSNRVVALRTDGTTWRVAAESLWGGRFGAAALTSDGTDLFALLAEGGTPYARLAILPHGETAWRIRPLPPRCASVDRVAVAWDRAATLYLALSNAAGSAKAFLRYAIDADSFTDCNNGFGGTAGHLAVVTSGVLHLPGGGGAGRLYDPGTDAWTADRAAPPTADPWRAACAVAADAVVALTETACSRFDAGGNAWTPLAAPPAALDAGSAAAYTLPVRAPLSWRDARGTARARIPLGAVVTGGSVETRCSVVAASALNAVTLTAPAAGRGGTLTLSRDGRTFASSVALGNLAAGGTADVWLRLSAMAVRPGALAGGARGATTTADTGAWGARPLRCPFSATLTAFGINADPLATGQFIVRRDETVALDRSGSPLRRPQDRAGWYGRRATLRDQGRDRVAGVPGPLRFPDQVVLLPPAADVRIDDRIVDVARGSVMTVTGIAGYVDAVVVTVEERRGPGDAV